MCMLSAVFDQYGDRWRDRWTTNPPTTTTNGTWTIITGVSREEFEALKAEVESLKELLKAAKKFDDATGQPDCEMEEKMELVKRIAELVGVDLSEVVR